MIMMPQMLMDDLPLVQLTLVIFELVEVQPQLMSALYALLVSIQMLVKMLESLNEEMDSELAVNSEMMETLLMEMDETQLEMWNLVGSVQVDHQQPKTLVPFEDQAILKIV